MKFLCQNLRDAAANGVIQYKWYFFSRKYQLNSVNDPSFDNLALFNPNRYMKAKPLHLLLVAVSSCFWLNAFSQVSFTNQGNLLGTVFGTSFANCAVDMNGDYLDDVVRVIQGTIYIDYQQPNGTFNMSTFSANLLTNPDWSICAGDLDGNGYNDLLIGGGSRVAFVMADATGSNYTETQHPEFIFSQRSTMQDIDNDGDLDAFVCHDIDQSHPYRNDGTGNMTLDSTLIRTADLPGNYAAIWTDYNNDGHTDLYITKCRAGASPGDPTRTNLLYHNNGDGTYTEMGAAANMDDNSQSWATVFEDFDNDGDFDAFIVNHDFQNLLMENNNDGTFTNKIAGSGIDSVDLGAWENVAADFDNDGYVDILAQLNLELHLNNGNMTFSGIDLPFSSGGLGDFNNDGFIDVVFGNDLWINDANQNHWVKVTLEGTQSNPNGIGSRVEIFGSWGRQMREIRSTQGFSPMSTLNGHFGIGAATAIDSIVVHWPSGSTSMIPNPAIDTTHHIVELMVSNTPAFSRNMLKLFPNPAHDLLGIEIEGMVTGEVSLQVLNANGQVVLENDWMDEKKRVLDVSVLPRGFYVIRAAHGEHVFTRNLVLQ